MVPLPLELYRTIISEVKRPQDLQTLATVSRTIQPEAERRIWHRYDGNFNLQGTIRFCHALSSAPRFAPYVHELNLYSYIRAPDDNLPSDEVIVEMLSGVFEQTTNLRSLAIGLSGPAPCSCATLFERSAFHLHTFSPQWLLFDDRMTAFLAKQMSIRSLHPGIDFVRSPLLDVVIPQGILPQLAAISGTDGFIAKNIRNRPVSYIGFDCGVPLSLLSGDALSMEPVKGVELYYGVAATESEALRSPHFANLELLCGLSVRTKEVRIHETHLGIESSLIYRYLMIGRDIISLIIVKTTKATVNGRLYILQRGTARKLYTTMPRSVSFTENCSDFVRG
jgi:hypothetical protein